MTSIMSIMPFSPEIQYRVLKMVEKYCASLNKKEPLSEEFLGPLACEPEHYF